jgi:photosystem II stability/assembly factor-like uncharacterized protein
MSFHCQITRDRVRALVTRVIVLGITSLASIWLFETNHEHKNVDSPKTDDVAQPEHPLYLSSKFEWIGNLPTAVSGSYGLQFIDESEGWLFQGKHLWHTKDGGKTWSHIYSIDEESFDDIREIRFVHSGLGWMMRLSELYRSENRGRTWDHIRTPMDGTEGSLWSFHFEKHGKLGWIAGGIYYPTTLDNCINNATGILPDGSYTCLNGAVFQTEDGGLTWYQQSTTRNVGRFLSIDFIDSEHGWVAGDAGVLHTIDGGRTWRGDKFRAGCKDYYRLQDMHPASTFFLDREIGWLFFSSGLIAKSTNGGRTWCNLFDPATLWPNDDEHVFPTRQIDNVHFQSATDGVALDTEGLLYESNDGGATWKREGTLIKFDSLAFLDASNGFAISKDKRLFRFRL